MKLVSHCKKSIQTSKHQTSFLFKTSFQNIFSKHLFKTSIQNIYSKHLFKTSIQAFLLKHLFKIPFHTPFKTPSGSTTWISHLQSFWSCFRTSLIYYFTETVILVFILFCSCESHSRIESLNYYQISLFALAGGWVNFTEIFMLATELYA